MTRGQPHRTVFAALLAIFGGACDEAPKPSVSLKNDPNTTIDEPAAVEKVAEPPASVRAPTSASTSASEAPPKPSDRFTRAPASDRRTLAHILEPKQRIGAYLGLPDGWRNDDPSYLLFFPRKRDPQPAARAVAMTLREPGLAEANKARLLKRGPEPTGLRDASWSSWERKPLGRGPFDAAVARGTGQSVRGAEGPRKAIAVVVAIPGAPALGFVGSWATSQPQQEEAILDMLRAVERCQVEVGRGCVTAEERERASL